MTSARNNFGSTHTESHAPELSDQISEFMDAFNLFSNTAGQQSVALCHTNVLSCVNILKSIFKNPDFAHVVATAQNWHAFVQSNDLDNTISMKGAVTALRNFSTEHRESGPHFQACITCLYHPEDLFSLIEQGKDTRAEFHRSEFLRLTQKLSSTLQVNADIALTPQ